MIPPESLVSTPVLAVMTLMALATSYLTGPGWLPHDPCPHCCWCTGRVPFGTRAERRLFGKSYDDIGFTEPETEGLRDA